MGFLSSPFRSPIASSSIGFLFYFFSSKVSISIQHEGNGLALTASFRVEFCLGRICAAERQSRQISDTKTQALCTNPRGDRSRGGGQQDVSITAQLPNAALKLCERLAFGLFVLYLQCLQLPEGVWGEQKSGIWPFTSCPCESYSGAL